MWHTVKQGQGMMLRHTLHSNHRPQRSLHTSRLVAVLVFLTLVSATAWTFPPQQGESAVVGRVINGSAGGSVPAGIEVVLYVFLDTEEEGTYTTSVAADGTFRFEDLSLAEGETLIARVVYEGVEYSSDPATVESAQDELALELTVYETTQDPSDVQVAQLHLFISRVEDRIRIGEYHLIGNTGDKTYVGQLDPESGRSLTLSYALPEGAEELTFDGAGLGERFVEREGGFADGEPILPGASTVETLFSYELPFRADMQVERSFDVPVSSVVLLLSEQDISLEGAGIASAGALDTQMGPAFSYTAGPIMAGESLVFTLLDRPQAAMPSAPFSSSTTGSPLVRNAAREISVGLVVLAAAVVVAYFLWQPSAEGSPPRAARPLVEAIAALDADFQAGEVAEKSYQRKRRALKRQLRTLIGGERPTDR
jgi:hypothetical protein